MDINISQCSTIDMHIHSCYSEDGEYAPAALIQMCIDAGISIMAIADHNCVKGAREALLLKADLEAYNNTRICCYPAIEIDCTYQNVNFHVLGYNIDLDSADFDVIEQNVRKQCLSVSRERLGLINEFGGFQLTPSDLNAVTAGSYWCEHWTGEAFAEALLTNPSYKESDLLKPYRKNGTRSDNPYVNFYWDYFSQGTPCHISMSYPEMEDVIHLIHRNHGKAVLAHPGMNLKGNYDMLDLILTLGIDGLEAYSSYHDPHTVEWFVSKARQNHLFVTMGSDFHGKTKPGIKLGS